MLISPYIFNYENQELHLFLSIVEALLILNKFVVKSDYVV